MTATEQFITRPQGPSPTGEALCRLCSEESGGCCRTDPALSHLSFPLSLPEWRRLAPYSALAALPAPKDGEAVAPEEEAAVRAALAAAQGPGPETAGPGPDGDALCAPEPNAPDFLASMHALFPGKKRRIDELFPVGGRHFALRLRPDGACVFLGREGCRLPRPARPWYCLIFPAWLMDGGLTLFLSDACLIAQKARGPAHGLGLLEENPAHIRELHARLRTDWGLASPPKRHDLYPDRL